MKLNIKNSFKIYCRITIVNDSVFINFSGTGALVTLKKLREHCSLNYKNYNAIGNNGEVSLINLDDIYTFLADNKFIPVTETFFYKNADKDDMWN
jgi:hypothetical protein